MVLAPFKNSFALWHGSCYKDMTIRQSASWLTAKKPRRVGTEGPLSLGKHHTEPGEFGVFFYRCEGRFHFEDFERSPSLLGISLKPKRSKTPFVKFEGSFAASDVVLTRPVPKSAARQVIDGKWMSTRSEKALCHPTRRRLCCSHRGSLRVG